MFRTDGSTVRALLLALAVQILLPLLGVLPAQAAPSADTMVICTAHGMVTLVADGQGGWEQTQQSAETGISCSFCLPLLAVATAPSVAPGILLPVVTTLASPRYRDEAAPRPVLTLSARPRGPPILV
ncbi:DUF2946 family protein [Magnetospirillum sulfuroxidans]|uniref:DUF2946 family protein n=1 Tax=Magnetospirillum sulfuroxidans TaxID=611300 RepID=A0ABS5IB13_9PROT|nr:DUF2946 family protein [Magnetospirillum sulfuroxidans]MBR9970943.1 DUF2946 family protein [Magnetospirillum sulfuroxidans]